MSSSRGKYGLDRRELTASERARKLLVERASRQHIAKLYQRMALRNSAESGQLTRRLNHLRKAQHQWLANHDAGVRIFKLEKRRELLSAPPKLASSPASTPSTVAPLPPLGRTSGRREDGAEKDDGNDAVDSAAVQSFPSPSSSSPPPQLPFDVIEDVERANQAVSAAEAAAEASGTLHATAAVGAAVRSRRSRSAAGFARSAAAASAPGRLSTSGAFRVADDYSSSGGRADGGSRASVVSTAAMRCSTQSSPLPGRLPAYLALTDAEMAHLRKQRQEVVVQSAKQLHDESIRACDEKLRLWLRLHPP